MLMDNFHMTEDQAMSYPLIKALALAAWKTENNPWCAVQRVGDGYVAQEAFRLREIQK